VIAVTTVPQTCGRFLKPGRGHKRAYGGGGGRYGSNLRARRALGAREMLTYSVRLGSLNGEVLGTYRHHGPDEPRRGTLLSPQEGLEGGPWRVSD
jgi:hypothetical protein